MASVTFAGLRASIALRPPKSAFHGETWTKDTENGVKNPQPVTLAQLSAQMKPEERDSMEQTGFQSGWNSAWTRGVSSTGGGLNAEALGLLFRNPHGARKAAALVRALDAREGAYSSTPDVAPIPALKLGAAGWAFHFSGGDEAYEYGFALRNAVIVVYMLCWDDNCDPAQHVRGAIRRYARAIAARATS